VPDRGIGISRTKLAIAFLSGSELGIRVRHDM
jgi:hypothetical protein